MAKAQVHSTPEAIAHFRLCSLKGHVRLESYGMKNSSGRAIRPILAKELGLKPLDGYDMYIAALDAKIEASLAAMPVREKT